MTGPGASIGIPYSKGTAAGIVYRDDVNGIKIKVEQLDDTSDPSTGTRDARKLIEQDNVDVLMGAGNTPITLAIVAVSHEQKVPLIALVPTGESARRFRLVDDFHSAAPAVDGRSGGRAHESDRRQDGWLHRVQRRLG